MIDIHAHILPSIDDGARNASETFDMIKEAEKNGITEIHSLIPFLNRLENDCSPISLLLLSKNF